DGRRAATCDGGVRVWDAATGKELRRLALENPNLVLALALTPDGQGLLTSTHEARVVPRAWTWRFSFSASTHEARVVLWDVATRNERGRAEIKNRKDGPAPNVGAAVFSPDGKLLAAPYFEGVTDNTPLRTGVRLWDVATGKEVRRVGGTLKEGESAPEVREPVFSPDGKVVAGWSLDGTVRLYGTGDGKEQRSLGGSGKDEALSGVAFSPA